MKAVVKKKKGTKRKKANAKKTSDLDYMLGELEDEHLITEGKMKKRRPRSDDMDRFGFYTHVCVAAMACLHWIGGDPSDMSQFPESFKGQRLVKACQWLTEQLGDSGKVAEARLAQVKKVHELWPKYAVRCAGLMAKDEVATFSWEGLVSTHDGAEEEDPAGLPKFHIKISEDFHLTCMCVVFLNRASSRKLLDLRVE